MPAPLHGRVRFAAGDMLCDSLGRFDHMVAMDSLIYYNRTDIAGALDTLAQRLASHAVFTVAPRTALLMAMWARGAAFSAFRPVADDDPP